MNVPAIRLPAAVQLVRYAWSPLPFLENAHARHGDRFVMRLAGFRPPLVMLSDPADVAEVFRSDPDALHSGEANAFLAMTLGDSSVLVLDGEAHGEQRRALSPAMRGERLSALAGVILDVARDEVDSWTPGRVFRALPSMRRIALRVMVRAVLGLAAGAREADVGRRIEAMLAYGRNRFSLFFGAMIPWRRLRPSRVLPFFRELNDVDALVLELIRERRGGSSSSHHDVLGDLLAARHADGSPLSDSEVRDAIVTMLVAGHDTTAVALAWALERIAPRDDVVAAIRAEVESVTGGAPLAAEHLQRSSYLDAAIRESLRQRTVIPFVVRLVKREVRIGGRDYPPDVMLAPCIHLVHRRPDLYPEPDRFRPERFLERRFGPHEWFPLGGGNRTCLGFAFTMLETKAVLATVFSSVDLARPEGAASFPVRRGLPLAPHDETRVIARPRT